MSVPRSIVIRRRRACFGLTAAGGVCACGGMARFVRPAIRAKPYHVRPAASTDIRQKWVRGPTTAKTRYTGVAGKKKKALGRGGIASRKRDQFFFSMGRDERKTILPSGWLSSCFDRGTTAWPVRVRPVFSSVCSSGARGPFGSKRLGSAEKRNTRFPGWSGWRANRTVTQFPAAGWVSRKKGQVVPPEDWAGRRAAPRWRSVFSSEFVL